MDNPAASAVGCRRQGKIGAVLGDSVSLRSSLDIHFS